MTICRNFDLMLGFQIAHFPDHENALLWIALSDIGNERLNVLLPDVVLRGKF